MIFSLEDVSKHHAQGAGYSLLIRRLRIARGERIALTGVSGSGKSTALDILGMVLRPDAARNFLFAPAGKSFDIAAFWRKKSLDAMAGIRLRHVGYVLQTGGLLPYLSVAENMGLVARMRDGDGNSVASRTVSVAEALGIAHLLNSRPSTLSVGERQRVAIGRALAPRPDVVLADEPTAALDPIHAENVMSLFATVVKEMGTTLVMVSHDMSLVRGAGLRIVEISLTSAEDGSVLATIDDSGHAPCATLQS
ncbi:MAG: ATP-binding cassette domain-containing protein [Desulfovibrio sp.]|jgi:putative ABC transport system ATP-binding protein|nr:ATP-binding cassette domain-containing protein [Desulfovibrio sp.]